MALVDWKPNPPIDQHCHQHELLPAIPDINCTDPVSTNQQLHLSDLLTYLYSNDYSLHEPPQGQTPSYPCVAYDNNNFINAVLTPESITPNITVFYKWICQSGSCLSIFIGNKYYPTIPWLWPGALSKWHHDDDGIKLVSLLIEKLREIYVRKFHIDSGANY